LHQEQLQALNIPSQLFESLKNQLETYFLPDVHHNENENERTNRASLSLFDLAATTTPTTATNPFGSILVIPHVCDWDIRNNHRGMIQELEKLSDSVLQAIWDCLETVWWGSSSNSNDNDKGNGTSNDNHNNDQRQLQVPLPPPQPSSREMLVDQIARHARIWSHVILYRSVTHGHAVRAALPAPPFYFPHVAMCESEMDLAVEADLTGPFPFQYYYCQMHEHAFQEQSKKDNNNNNERSNQFTIMETSLAYLSPDVVRPTLDGRPTHGRHAPLLPTMDVVPSYSCPNVAVRSVRYAALLGDRAPTFAVEYVKLCYANLVQQMHLVRQNKLQQEQERQQQQQQQDPTQEIRPAAIPSDDDDDDHHHHQLQQRVWKVYTDTNDPMELAHPEAGLTDPQFQLTDQIEDADIIFSYQSLFTPGSSIQRVMEEKQKKKNNLTAVLMNQFPYEGAFVQKDHLAREVLKQHGLPRPAWAIESYDLDVHLAEFIGAALLSSSSHSEVTSGLDNEASDEPPPLWIVKPARGTQSKGHLVSRSTAHIQRLLDAGGTSRVAQRYIDRPVCVDGHKLDCRCIVLMAPNTTNGRNGRPMLYMHNRVYFRIANKPHSVATIREWTDPESVLTANHLLDEENRSSTDALRLLPVDVKTIAKLEQDYGAFGFCWKDSILPQIHDMIRELFNGMTRAFPAMCQSKQSRAIYGVDIIFAIEEDGNGSSTIVPKLTEVTFCPANNAICDAYERDDDLYRSYNNDVFNCMFLGKVSKNITRLQ